MIFSSRLLQICVNLFQRARRRVLIEMAVEVDLVADFVLATVHPSVGHMRPHLALEIGVDVVLKWHILEIAQFGIRLVAFLPAIFPDPLGLRILLGEDIS